MSIELKLESSPLSEKAWRVWGVEGEEEGRSGEGKEEGVRPSPVVREPEQFWGGGISRLRF